MQTTKKAIALIAIAALTACGGGTKNPVIPASTPAPSGNTAAGSMFSNMVGVGDSLTAGYQSDGLLGVNTTATAPVVSAFPGGLVPAGQYNGYWALLYEQATGTTAASMANPLTSVLPLINAPGINSQLVPIASGGFAPSHPSCDTFNQAAFSAGGFTTVRANPGALVRDFGVPGITAHEALNMYNPLTPTCVAFPTTDPTAALEPLLASESENFIPILGGSLSPTAAQKLKNGQPSSEVSAAAALNPTFATVWLGANDLLHYIESAGQYTGVDVVPGQMQADITTTIQTLQHSGAQGVAVANLPTVLETPQFFEGGTPTSAALCATQNWLYCDVVAQLTTELVGAGDPLPVAQGTAQAYAAAAVANLESQSAYGFGNDNGWYIMEGGYAIVIGTLNADLQHSVPPTGVAINLDGTSPAGSLLGQNYVSDALAAKATALNTQWNNEIDAAATNTGAALVDVNTIFNQIYTGSGPYFTAAVSINPAPNPATGLPFTCCTLVFNQGLTSLDGLHPSNSGYALIANAFIQAIDTKYTSANIPPLSAGQIEAIYATDPYAHL